MPSRASPQRAPRHSDEVPRMPQDGPGPPRRPKRPSRQSKGAPKHPRTPPNTTQEAQCQEKAPRGKDPSRP
eukprot:6355638-Pyramimonas_sp.AAC.1